MDSNQPRQPFEVDQWSTLHSLIEEYVDETIFKEFKAFIEPPLRLIGFDRIALNLIDILPYSYGLLGSSHPHSAKLKEMIPQWVEYCRIIVDNCKTVQSVIPEFCKAGKTAFTPPLIKYYRTNPLYVLLWCSVKEPDAFRARFHLLQAVISLSFFTLKDLEDTLDYKYTSAKYSACLYARHLADSFLYQNILSQLPATAESLREYFKSLDIHDETITHIKPLLVYAISRSKGVTHLTTGRKARGDSFTNQPFSPKETSFYIGNDDGTTGEQLTTQTIQSIGERELRSQIRAGCAGEEFTSSTEAITNEHPGKDPSGGRSSWQLQMEAKGAVDAIIMRNQRLRLDWEMLNDYDIESFLFELRELAASNAVIENVPASTLAAFICAMFWTSRPPQSVFFSVQTLSPTIHFESMAIIVDRGRASYWLLHPYEVSLKCEIEPEAERQAVAITRTYSLPIVREAGNILQRHISSLPLTYEPVRIFAGDLKNFTDAADDFFSRLRRKSSGRQNLLRVSRYMHERLAQHTAGDITTSMAVSGRQDALGSVPMHYTASNTETIESIYRDVCTEILASSGMSAVWDTTKTKPRRSTLYIGSRYVPSQQSVRSLVQGLRSRLEDARAAVPSNMEEINRLHNVYVAYTVMLLGFATGFRSVHDPLLSKAEIDRGSGFAVISDKDDDEFSSSRIVWLPEVCFKQLDSYSQHLREMQSWLFMHNQQIFFNVRQEAIIGRMSERSNPSLFILKSSNEGLNVQPAVLRDLMRIAQFRLPINSNRHYLRTRLKETGCPVEVINAYMGHWNRGLEPWGRYSGMSPLSYREELSKHLVPMLQEDGWQAEQGYDRNKMV